MTDETPKKITKKQQIFIDEYLRCFNGAEAARRAGYSESRARTTAAELMAESSISEQIQARLAEVHMSADEAIKRLSDMARGDIGEFITSFGGIDLAEAKKNGLTPLIKKVKQRTVTKIGKKDDDEDVEVHDLEIELYSAKDAIDTILRVNGKLKGDAPIINIAKGYIGWTPDNWKDDEAKDTSPV